MLKNYGTLTLQQGGDFKDFASITNYTYGVIEVAGGTLNVEVDVANYGHITVDAGATMTVERCRRAWRHDHREGRAWRGRRRRKHDHCGKRWHAESKGR